MILIWVGIQKAKCQTKLVTTFLKLKNEFSKPLESTFGWHIIKLLDIKEKKEVKFEDVKEQFKNEILLDKGKRLFTTFRMNLKIY